MTETPHIIGEAEDSEARQSSESKVDRAIAAFEAGNHELARTHIEAFMRAGQMSAIDGARAAELFRVLGMEERAKEVREIVLKGIDQALEEFGDNPSVLFDCGHTLAQMKEPEKAIAPLERALALRPKDPRPAFPLIEVLLERGEPDRLVEIWLPMLEANFDTDMGGGNNSDLLWGSFARALAFYGFKEHALKVVAMAKDFWHGSDKSWQELDDAVRLKSQDNPSLAEAVASFDKFAEIYDENLEAIGNNGPRLIALMLAQLAWVPEAKLEIFDAGCGTGLCAEHLRPFAKILHGCDLSIPMLERAKARAMYDLLVRTDLGNAATYPEAIFDVCVAADVFVYFGDLEPVLKNISNILRPGGWIIFTVECAEKQAPKRGWERYVSGRFRHTPDYVRAALPKAGFAKPKSELPGIMRHEFGKPIDARCYAAQKLALAF